MQNTLKELISKAGGTVRVASACGVTPGAVSQWIKAGHLPLTEVQGKTDHARKLLDMSGMKADEWDVRLIGRR
ncbi:MAG TPA: hypothetical protein VFM75_01980 [Modicisalibacter sp.]|nr:hypothetical protein [Modicisalibacter sp.]